MTKRSNGCETGVGRISLRELKIPTPPDYRPMSDDNLVVVDYPTLPRDRGMAEDHGAPEAE